MSPTAGDAAIARVGAVFLGALALITGATFYWSVLRGPELMARPDNPRRIVADRLTRRGRLLDRHGTVLAETVFDAEGPRRVYPVPEAAPVTGYQTWRFGAGGTRGAAYGAGGAEAAYDVALRGDLGRSPRALVAGSLLDRPREGHDVVLTLDATLQREAARLLGERPGAIVLLAVADGAVRALVSAPSFDPSALDAGAPADPSALLDRVTQGRYPPGSTWKTITLAAAYEAGIARPDQVSADGDAVETFDGFPVRCNNAPEGVTTFDLVHAFAYSCNVTFARLADQLGEARFRAAATAFGLDARPPFPLPAAAGQITSHAQMSAPELASAGFGQGELLATPLHMALAAAAMAGDGSLPTPYLLADVPGVRWGSLADERGTWRRATSAATARLVREAMVVSADEGWARSARLGRDPSFRLGAKTGTAEVGAGRPHAWTIGFAPAERPTVAAAVLIEGGGEGAGVAAPIAGALLELAAARDAGAP